MNCHNVQSLLTLYASGDLGYREAVGVRKHLQKCPDCALALERERDVLGVLKKAGRNRKTPRGVLDDITAGVMSRLGEEQTVPLALYRGVPAWGRVKSVAALAALVLIAVILLIAVLPEMPVTSPVTVKPTNESKPDIVRIPSPFETLGEERLGTRASDEVRVPNSRYRRNWREPAEPATPDGVPVVPTGGSRF